MATGAALWIDFPVAYVSIFITTWPTELFCGYAARVLLFVAELRTSQHFSI